MSAKFSRYWPSAASSVTELRNRRADCGWITGRLRSEAEIPANPASIPGNAGQSGLFQLVSSKDEDERIPPLRGGGEPLDGSMRPSSTRLSAGSTLVRSGPNPRRLRQNSPVRR